MTRKDNVVSSGAMHIRAGLGRCKNRGRILRISILDSEFTRKWLDVFAGRACPISRSGAKDLGEGEILIKFKSDPKGYMFHTHTVPSGDKYWVLEIPLKPRALTQLARPHQSGAWLWSYDEGGFSLAMKRKPREKSKPSKKEKVKPVQTELHLGNPVNLPPVAPPTMLDAEMLKQVGPAKTTVTPVKEIEPLDELKDALEALNAAILRCDNLVTIEQLGGGGIVSASVKF